MMLLRILAEKDGMCKARSWDTLSMILWFVVVVEVCLRVLDPVEVEVELEIG